jgi:IMP dehydrogenase
MKKYKEKKMKTALSFDDVLLVPRMSKIQSRSEVSLCSCLREETWEEDTNRKVPHVLLNLPIISSPMDTVTGRDMAIAMEKAGGLGIVHRYCSIDEQIEMVKPEDNKSSVWDEVLISRKSSKPQLTFEAPPIRRIAAAIGVTGDYMERAQELVNNDCNIFCVDVAHGHHISVKKALKALKKEFGDRAIIIAGNVATAKGYEALSRWGADAVRVGIGGGSICSTRIQTGHGVPTFQSILDCINSEGDAYIIADGGIRNSGDIVKALAAGADFVMLGSLLAGTDESPGQVFSSGDGKKYKVYRGMASVEAQVEWRGEARSLEGVSTTIPYKGSVKKILADLEQNIRSGLSYSGARDLAELFQNAKFIQQTNAGMRESNTHILLR